MQKLYFRSIITLGYKVHFGDVWKGITDRTQILPLLAFLSYNTSKFTQKIDKNQPDFTR